VEQGAAPNFGTRGRSDALSRECRTPCSGRARSAAQSRTMRAARQAPRAPKRPDIPGTDQTFACRSDSESRFRNAVLRGDNCERISARLRFGDQRGPESSLSFGTCHRQQACRSGLPRSSRPSPDAYSERVDRRVTWSMCSSINRQLLSSVDGRCRRRDGRNRRHRAARRAQSGAASRRRTSIGAPSEGRESTRNSGRGV
jgi:hypothetical protein